MDCVADVVETLADRVAVEVAVVDALEDGRELERGQAEVDTEAGQVAVATGRVAGEDVYLKPGLAQVLEKYGWDKVLQKLDLQKEAGKRCPVCKEAFRFPDDLLDHLKVHLYEVLMKFENEQARAKRASVQ